MNFKPFYVRTDLLNGHKEEQAILDSAVLYGAIPHEHRSCAAAYTYPSLPSLELGYTYVGVAFNHKTVFEHTAQAYGKDAVELKPDEVEAHLIGEGKNFGLPEVTLDVPVPPCKPPKQEMTLRQNLSVWQELSAQFMANMITTTGYNDASFDNIAGAAIEAANALMKAWREAEEHKV